MRSYVVGEHLDGIPNPRGTRIVGCHRNLSLPQKFPNQFVLLPSLRFDGFARRYPGTLAKTFPTFPPFKKVVASALVPDVLSPNSVETDKFPQAPGYSDLFDDPYTLLGYPARSPRGTSGGGFRSVASAGAGRVHWKI